MTTYSKETALYDTGAIKNGIDEAATTATNYLTTISGTTGISVHNANDEKNFVNMNSTDGVTIYRNIDGTATDVSNFGEKVRVGEKDGSRLEVDSSGITGYVSNGRFLSVDNNGAIDKTSEIIYSTDEEVQVGNSYVILTNVYPELKTNIHSFANGDEFDIRGHIKMIYRFLDFPALTMKKGEPYSIETSGTRFPPPMQDAWATYPASIVYDGSEEIKIKNLVSETVSLFGLELSIVVEGRTPTFTFGRNNQATGPYSVALNEGTKAIGYAQTVIGTYNEPDDNMALIIGRGSDEESRYNSLTVDWNGGIRTTPEQIATNVASTKGQYVSSTCYRFGQVVCLSLVFRNTSSVAAGADIYAATFTSTLPRPVVRVTSASYYGSHSIAGALDQNRGVTIRNASDTAYNIPSSSSASISFTYITND